MKKRQKRPDANELHVNLDSTPEDMVRQMAALTNTVANGLAASLLRGGVGDAAGVVLGALATTYRQMAVVEDRLTEAVAFAQSLLVLADRLAEPLNTALTGAVDWLPADAIHLSAVTPVYVSGAVRGPFAVHRAVNGDGWRLTHLLTGRALTEAQDEPALRRLAEQIEKLCDWNWTDQRSPEALAAKDATAPHILAFRRRHRDLTDFQPAGRA